MAFTKPSNLIATKAYQAIQAAAADITFSLGKIQFNGVGQPIPLKDFIAFRKTLFAAGTLQVDDIDYTAVVAADNTPFNLFIRRGDNGEVKQYQIITGTGATTASIASAFNTAIGNDLNAIVTSTVLGSVITVTEETTDTKGL